MLADRELDAWETFTSYIKPGVIPTVAQRSPAARRMLATEIAIAAHRVIDDIDQPTELDSLQYLAEFARLVT